MALHYTEDPGSIPVAVLGGLALGAGGRLAKNLIDLARRPPTDTVVNVRPEIDAVTKIPVVIKPEEADELRRRGISVRKVLKQPKVAGSASALGGVGLGALGTLGAYGGWSLADHVIDTIRKKQARKDVDDVRTRLERLLDATPDAPEAPMGRALKLAAAEYVKRAGISDMIGSAAISGAKGIMNAVPSPIAVATGAGLTLAGLAAYNKAKKNSIYAAKAKSLKALLAKRPVDPSYLSMEPVVIEDGATAEDIDRVAPGAYTGSPASIATAR